MSTSIVNNNSPISKDNKLPDDIVINPSNGNRGGVCGNICTSVYQGVVLDSSAASKPEFSKNDYDNAELISAESHYESNAKALDELLLAMEQSNVNARDKGTSFENLILSYLKHDRALKEQYQIIETYADWAKRTGIPSNAKDIGVDLVATYQKPLDANSSLVCEEKYTAIQCKFYSKGHRVSKKDVDSFISALSQKHFSDGLVVTTSLEMTDNLTEIVDNSQKHIFVVNRETLANSSIKWRTYLEQNGKIENEVRTLRPYQSEAIFKAVNGLKTYDRGKLIMACGTGKTFTSLRLAEKWINEVYKNEIESVSNLGQGAYANEGTKHIALGGFVLFLVPSLSLLSQTLSDWTKNSERPISAFAVCSDNSIGKAKSRDNPDTSDVLSKTELSFPATTDAESLASKVKSRLSIPYDPQNHKHGMTVIFSTYQSIDVIIDAQLNFGLPEFDLVICDEAHRTAGGYVTVEGINSIEANKGESYLKKKNEQVSSGFSSIIEEGDSSNVSVESKTANKSKRNILSIDTEDSSFWKVHNNTLVHAKKRIYMTATPKVYGNDLKKKKEMKEVVLYSMDDEKIFGPVFYTLSFHQAVQLGCLVDYKVIVLGVPTSVCKNMDIKELSAYHRTRLIGSWKALNKFAISDLIEDDSAPMKRAVAFTQVIEPSKKHKVSSSKQLQSHISLVIDEYKQQVLQEGQASPDYENISSEHVDIVAKHIDGSMNAIEKGNLLNWLRDNSEDSDKCKILFNVRCLSEGVDVPALDAVIFFSPKSSQVEVVQTVGRVMRRAQGKKRGYVIIPIVTDDLENPETAFIKNDEYQAVWQVLNALRSLNPDYPLVDINGQRLDSRIEIVCMSDTLSSRKHDSKQTSDVLPLISPGIENDENDPQQIDLLRNVEIEEKLTACIIKKVGNRKEWDDWAKELGAICRHQISLITDNLKQPEFQEVADDFKNFKRELCAILRRELTDAEIIEMLGQHIVISPVLDALFPGVPFTSKNPLSKGLSGFVNRLIQKSDEHDIRELQSFAASVSIRMGSVQTLAEKQAVIVEVFDKFFKYTFSTKQKKLGIVYTPVEVVDFINNSVNELLKKEFGVNLSSEGVHVLDPFTGTGTFIARMMQDKELISDDNIYSKYLYELHAFEIVPLAYYVAAMNIESVMQERDPSKFDSSHYRANNVVILTDTFANPTEHPLFSSEFGVINEKREHVDKLDLTVIVGNPPYKSGQKSYNEYVDLDRRVSETYGTQQSLSDSYIRAFRWASDRIGNKGIIGFVTNAGYLDRLTTYGMRKSICKEFNDIYVYHLKGDQDTSGERSKQEGGKIFDSGCRKPIAITFMVKNPESNHIGKIHFASVKDYMSRTEKLLELQNLKHILNVDMVDLTMDEHGDLLSKRSSDTEKFMSVVDKKNISNGICNCYTNGIKTGADIWSINSSANALEKLFNYYVDCFNKEIELYSDKANEYVEESSSVVSWNLKKRNLRDRGIKQPYCDPSGIKLELYRPFLEQFVYFDNDLNSSVSQINNVFPYEGAENLLICITGPGAKRPFSIFMANRYIDLEFIHKGQCISLYKYTKQDLSLTDESTYNGFVREISISDEVLNRFREPYGIEGKQIFAEDIFFYIYGILHSKDYCSTYSDNLFKELPKIPRVEQIDDFMKFSKAGRALSELHSGYDTVEPYSGCNLDGNPSDDQLRVTKLRFADVRTSKGKIVDRSCIVYNEHLIIKNVPLEAYEYKINDRSPIDWILHGCCIKDNDKMGVMNDYNEIIKHKKDPWYLVKLILRAITLSLETNKIVSSLPKLVIHQLDK